MHGSTLLSLLLGLLLGGCVLAPARVTRTREHDQRKLYALLTAALDPTDEKAAAKALGRFVEQWHAQKRGAVADLPPEPPAQAPTYRVRFASGAAAFPGPSHLPQPLVSSPLDYFDTITPAGDFTVTKLAHHTRAGIGAPLVALRTNRAREPIERFYPPESISRPLTAVAVQGKLHNGVQEVRIQILCPLAHDTVVIGGQRRPLAADFSVPWAAALAHAGKLNQRRVMDMLTPSPQRKPQLYLMEPYDPRKEPLIMIHGLLSTPLTWASLSNELWADDEIRSRYQIWHYLYNTSAPALYSTRILRAQLKELRRTLDPEGDDPAMQRTTLLTHSMGGLVGKALAIRPGDAFWKAAFKVPQQSLKLDEADLTVLSDAFGWEPDPTIHRMIFIATPHLGSAFADNMVGRMGSWVTRPPQEFHTFFTRVSATNPGVFTPEYVALGRGSLDGVSSLSPRQPTLRILSEMSFAHPVQTHSIIGNRGRPGPLESSSDGIVPYSSSHLPAATSELIVPANHGAFRHPQAVAEVKRVLKLPVQ